MLERLSNKTWLILILVGMILLLLLVPIENLFGKPSILGAVLSKVFVRGQEIPMTCNIPLADGWNLIGIGCKKGDMSVESVMAPIDSIYVSIHGYNMNGGLDKWKSYNPSMPNYVIQDLDTLDVETGYWVNSRAVTLFSYNGTIELPNSISLLKGLNLISYPRNESQEISTALATIDGRYTIVYAYNTTLRNFTYYNASTMTGNLSELKYYEGYWINMTSNGILWIT
jgi:hypothetical protein